MKYIKELDSLRAFAVTLVIISHIHSLTYFKSFALGGIGVGFFFVLSGFLITGILLHEKNKPDSSLGNTLKIFYSRRTLRIFPAYYLFLWIVYSLGNKQIVEHPFYFLFYGSNILFFKQASYAGELSPTWSLAVEEQFYITWPLLLLAVNKKYTKQVIIAGIIFSPLFKIIVTVLCKVYGQNSSLIGALMPSNIIYLLSGAYLAWLTIQKSNRLAQFTHFIIPILLIACYYVLHLVIHGALLNSFLFQGVVTMVSVWIINLILIRNKAGNSINWLKNKVMVYIGKISYGMYLYHTIAVSLLLSFMGNYNVLLQHPLTDFIVTYSCTFLVASVSWFLFEKPINSWKNKLSYGLLAKCEKEITTSFEK